MRRTVDICYRTATGSSRVFSHSFTGTQEEIDAEMDRMMSLPDVREVWSE